MKNPERTQSEYNNDTGAENIAAKRLEALSEKNETYIEHTDKNIESLIKKNLSEALATATSIESDTKETKRDDKNTKSIKRGPLNKKTLDKSYSKTLKQTQEELNLGENIFSKIIHAKGIESTSNVIGSTVARPNAILTGAITSFVFTLSVYIIAKKIGYELSGFEPIIGFAVGWLIGIIYDYFKLLITGKKD